jgi:hypothetical protein
MSNILPPTIVVHADLRVAICAQHKSCYVKLNLQRYLRDAYLIHSNKDLNISVYIESLNIVDTLDNVQRPINRIRSIPSLPTYNGFKCAAS